MYELRIGDKWKELLAKDAELRDLADRAGLTENPTRVHELWQAMENGRKIGKGQWERALAIYLYCHYS